MNWISLVLSLSLLAGPAAPERARFRVAWKAPCEFLQGIHFPLAANDRYVFFDHIHLVQRNLRNGKLKRRISKAECDGPITDIRVARNRVLFLCEHTRSEEEMVQPVAGPRQPDATLRVVRLGNGRLAWEHDGLVPEPLAVGGERVFFVDGDTLQARDVVTGKQAWKTPAGTDIFIGPEADDRLVYLQGEEGLLQAFSSGTGTKTWEVKLAGKPRAPLTIGSDHLFVTRLVHHDDEEVASALYAVDKKTGKVAWEKKLRGEDAFYQGAVWGGYLLLPTMGAEESGHLYALMEKSGHQRWKKEIYPDASGNDFRPLVIGDQILMWSGSVDQHGDPDYRYVLLNLDARTGETNWYHRPPGLEKPVYSRPIARSGLLIYSDGERIYALRKKPGRDSKTLHLPPD